MSHALPALGSPIRELFQVEDLVALSTGVQPLPVRSAAVASARKMIAGNRAIRSVVVFAADASDQVCLFQVGPRAVKRLWTFGPVPKSAVVA
jgi:hypothetical protein